MDQLQLTPAEERLYVACSNESRIKRHRQKTVLVTVLYAVVFAMLTMVMPIHPTFGLIIAILMIVYAFIVTIELRHTANLIFCYRSLIRKLLTRLKEKGADPDLYEKRLADNEDSSFEFRLARSATAISLIYAAILACLQIFLPALANKATGLATVLFVILVAILKIRAMNKIQAMKQVAFSTGKILNS
ncbi:MAG: hypothetical protein IJ992_07535 [Lentisphaeria bacterium]|nr:hypothetical protein [Lentisphaeria bacterium]